MLGRAEFYRKFHDEVLMLVQMNKAAGLLKLVYNFPGIFVRYVTESLRSLSGKPGFRTWISKLCIPFIRKYGKAPIERSEHQR